MVSLISADIHMTTVPKEDYRFGLFSWLAEQANNYRVDQVLILGDLTERHDRHPAHLVNRLVLGISEIAEVCPVYVLKGNHDCVDADWPFFGFLSGIPNVTFISSPERHSLKIRDQNAECIFLPSSDDPQAEWTFDDLSASDYVFMHQTIIGAAYESGMPADKGLPLTYFQGVSAEIYSGDIHSRQKLGTRPGPVVTYVGAPYHIRFGDKFIPRCLLLSAEGNRDLRFPCPVKHTIDITGDGEIMIPETVKIAPGDYVRVCVRLRREELPGWPRIRAGLIELGKHGHWGCMVGPSLELLPSGDPSASPAVLHSRHKLQPVDVLNRFSEKHTMARAVAEVGEVIVQEVMRQ